MGRSVHITTTKVCTKYILKFWIFICNSYAGKLRKDNRIFSLQKGFRVLMRIEFGYCYLIQSNIFLKVNFLNLQNYFSVLRRLTSAIVVPM